MRSKLKSLAGGLIGAFMATAASAEVSGGPAMWRLTDADSEIYLFGTFHILPPSLNWTTPALDAAMEKTPFTMTEADTDSPAAQQKLASLVRELGLNAPGITLSSQLGPERAKQFERVSARFGIPMASLEPMKPWLALISLAVGVMQSEGYSADAGAEEIIRQRATAQKDTFSHFETAEFQMRALAGLGNEEWLADFERSLSQMADFEGFSQRTLEAWRTGDLESIEAEMIGPMKAAAPGAYKTLIVDRNANWVSQIEKIMSGSDDYFIAVGAGHFMGEDGVVEMLKRKGYAVERVQ
ncbi:MAG: TraB/GumN family protein [Parvularculaceae bacterium]|nr:TraB/GumN family protein [Parvularculaceae bacterium]